MSIDYGAWPSAAILRAAAKLVIPALLIATPAAARELAAEDRADIDRVETYLNGLDTLEAKFVQINPDGGVADGAFYLSRPGRLRFQYDPPSPLLVVADGTWLILEDRELGQVSRWPIRRTPLGILVDEEVSLEGDVEVTEIDRGSGVLRVSLVRADEPEEGAITLVFSDAPLELRQWRIEDARGLVTTIALLDAKRGRTLDPALFRYRLERPQRPRR